MEIKALKCPECGKQIDKVIRISNVELHEETHIDTTGDEYQIDSEAVGESEVKYMCPELNCEHKEESASAFVTTIEVNEDTFGAGVEVITHNDWQYEIDEDTGVIYDNYSAEEDF